MTITLLVHIQNEEPIVGEVEELPNPEDNCITVVNPRLRNGKDLDYLADNVTTVVWPWRVINFIEVLPGDDEEEVIGFVRE